MLTRKQQPRDAYFANRVKVSKPEVTCKCGSHTIFSSTEMLAYQCSECGAYSFDGILWINPPSTNRS